MRTPSPIRRSFRRPTIVAVLTLTILCGAAASPQALRQKIDSALFEKVSREGTIAVIVELAAEPPAKNAGVPEVVRDQLIAERQDEMLAGMGVGHLKVRRRFAHIPFISLEVDRQALDELGASPVVAAVANNLYLEPQQTGLAFAQHGAPLVEADLAHAAGFDGSGFAVAVIDTGVDATHPYLGGRVVEEACISMNGDCPGGATEVYGAGSAVPCTFALICPHGTHVAGIAAGQTAGLFGVAPGADIIAINAFSNKGGTPGFALDDLAKALEHVYDLRSSHSIAAVNMSIAGGEFPSTCDTDRDYSVLSTAVGILSAADIAVVAASGNKSNKGAMGGPACLSQVVSVGATGFDGLSRFDFDRVAGLSNSSTELDLLAPGESIESSLPGGSYGIMTGTSMAAPHVAGAFAVLRQQNPNWTPGQVLSRLQATGFPVTDTNGITTASLRLGTALFGGTPLVANDRFVNATQIEGLSNDLDGSSFPSTRELLEPFHGGLSGGSSVWFRWRTPAATVQRPVAKRIQGSLETTGSSFDTVLAVYTGTALGNLTLVAENDDLRPGIAQSRVYFAMEENRQYFIAVDGFGGASGALKLLWNVEDSNFFRGRLPISGQSGSTTSTNQFADKEAFEPDHAGKTGGASIWWSWTAPTTGSYVFDTLGSAIDTLLAVYTGDYLSQVSLVAADDDSGGGGASRVVFAAQAGTTYQIAVDGDAGATGGVTLNWAPAQQLDHLAVYVHGQGTVGGPGIACPGDCDEDLAAGSTVNVSAVPQAGWMFTGWGGACYGQGATCTIVTSPATDVYALFDVAPLMSDGFESGDLSAWTSSSP